MLNKAFLRDVAQKCQLKRNNSAILLSNMKGFSAELTVSYQCVLRIFPSHLCRVLRMPLKSVSSSYEVLLLSFKMQDLSKPDDPMLQNATLLKKSTPDLLTYQMKMSSMLRLSCDIHLRESSSNIARLPSLLRLLQNPHVWLALWKCMIPCAYQKK